MTSMGVTGDRPLVYIACGLTKADESKLPIYRSIRDGCDLAGFDSYLPHEDTGARSDNLDPVRVCDANLAAINRSVAVVAEVSVASHGVGIEVQYAVDRGKPVVAVAQARTDLSRMLLGHPGLRTRIHRYNRAEEVPALVAGVLKQSLRGVESPRQRLIAIEGPDFVGKSTVARRLVTSVKERTGRPCELVTDPPWTLPPWDGLGGIFRSDNRLNRAAEALLFVAARVDNYGRIIRPKLEEGAVVILDRYIDSWFAYQSTRLGEVGFAHPLDFLLAQQTLLEAFQAVMPPGLTVLLMAPEEQLLERYRKRGGDTDKYEASGILRGACQAYEELALRFPHRIARVETSGRDPDKVSEYVIGIVEEYLQRTR